MLQLTGNVTQLQIDAETVIKDALTNNPDSPVPDAEMSILDTNIPYTTETNDVYGSLATKITQANNQNVQTNFI